MSMSAHSQFLLYEAFLSAAVFVWYLLIGKIDLVQKFQDAFKMIILMQMRANWLDIKCFVDLLVCVNQAENCFKT